MDYNWTLKDADFTKDKGKVFSCFACGGGSTMGYKLAGFDVIGCNEIDPKMMAAYKQNHNPKYSYLEGIQDFKDRKDLPKELYNLDILDGSPPCSSFSIAGRRDKDWGKNKKFREGQAEQVLDTLFFDFIDLAKELQPKVVVAENVKGMLLGKAKEYVKQIYKDFDAAGYYCQHFLLNAADMGVPQRRERVFFICIRKDIAEQFLVQKDMFTIAPNIELEFNEKHILFKEFAEYGVSDCFKKDSAYMEWWKVREPHFTSMSECALKVKGKETCFSVKFTHLDKTLLTLTRKDRTVCYHEPRSLTDTEFLKGCTFPIDYNFLNVNKTYLMGMSVPPIMMAKVSEQIYKQWLSKI